MRILSDSRPVEGRTQASKCFLEAEMATQRNVMRLVQEPSTKAAVIRHEDAEVVMSQQQPVTKAVRVPFWFSQQLDAIGVG
jgi:hypothetical protein